MPSNIGEILSELAKRNPDAEAEAKLISILSSNKLSLEFIHQRSKWTLSMSVKDEYLDGQTLIGTVDGHEIEILIPSSEHDQVKTLSKGDVLNIDAHFDKLNAYNRKVSFLGTLKSGLQELHPADIQKDGPAKEPDPIQSTELAEALKGKRIFVLMAGTLEKESTDPGDAKGDEVPETHPENMETVFQFERDGTINTGKVDKGSDVITNGKPNINPTYKVDGLRVTILENGKQVGYITFPSANPQKGDQISIGHEGKDDRITFTISRIENVASPTGETPTEEKSEIPKEPDEPPKPETKRPSAAKIFKPSGELAAFNNPNLDSCSAASERETWVHSGQIIALLAQETGSSRQDAARIVDGFWDYVANIKGHYREHSNSWTLTIPHFGNFQFRYFQDNRKMLAFKRTNGKSRSSPRSSGWVNQWNRKPGGLSVRRRISVFVAERTTIPLQKTDSMLNRLLDIIMQYSDKDTRISWGRRGIMKGNAFSASYGFLERMNAPSPGYGGSPWVRRPPVEPKLYTTAPIHDPGALPPKQERLRRRLTRRQPTRRTSASNERQMVMGCSRLVRSLGMLTFLIITSGLWLLCVATLFKSIRPVMVLMVVLLPFLIRGIYKGIVRITQGEPDP